MVYAYGKTDEQVGRLSQEEVAFLRNHGAMVLEGDGDHGSTIDKLVRSDCSNAPYLDSVESVLLSECKIQTWSYQRKTQWVASPRYYHDLNSVLIAWIADEKEAHSF